jgi:hypothetical protein
MTEPGKVECNECKWQGREAEADRVSDPKPGSNMVWEICPNCREANTLVRICDEPGCWKDATCGTPTPDGYRRVCGGHYGMFSNGQHAVATEVK